MGAGCSNGRALAVQDSVTKKLSLTMEGQEHLKQIVSNEESNKILSRKVNENERSVLNASTTSNDRKLPSASHVHLWEAVETNDIKVAEELLEKIATEQMSLSEADLFDSFGNSMAHKAASLGHAEILMLLLERSGAKPDISNSQLATPLHLACKNNRESVAKFLIGCGVDVNGQDENGQTPLLICCIHGNYDIAQLIIEASNNGHTPEPLEVDMRDHRGLTALNCAAIKGDLKFAKLLIEKASANVEEASSKGCSPVIYAARGGIEELVQYLILICKASPLRQDNSGATLFHHAVEKSNINVLQALLRMGSDFISAIEIADNAGRTPIYEAVDNNASLELLKLLLTKRSKKSAEGGYGAKVNVLNYSGQTPLFSAVRENNMELIRLLVEDGQAEVDLNGGEIVKDESEEGQNLQNDQYDSEEERNFMESYKNCMTPLHLACILGYDEVALYLINKGQANPNLQTSIKGYGCLHLGVLANKPEMLMELLMRSNANPNLPDYSGRTFIEMVEIHIPDYLETFTALLDNLQVERLKISENDNSESLMVITHYYNPDDEREIKGFKDQELDMEKHIEELHIKEQLQINDSEPDEQMVSGTGEITSKVITQKRFMEIDDSDIEVEEGKLFEKDVEVVFGRKIALGLIAVNFKYKEIAVKIILKHAEKLLSPNTNIDSSFNVTEFVKACTIAVDLTCKEKVIKVFNHCLQLLTLLITSAKVESSPLAIDMFKRVFTEKSITLKLLQRSEEGNTRLTNKIHECLLDYSFHPRIGEAHVSSFILQRINSHNKQSVPAIANAKPPLADSRNVNEGGALGSYKGLLAQLALLYKFVNSFGVSARKRGPLNSVDIVNAITSSLAHQSQDVRSASTKILLDVQRLSGAVKEEKLASLPEKIRNVIIEKLRAQVVEKNQELNKSKEGSDGQSQDDINGVLNSSRARDEDLEGETEVADWTGSKDQSLKSVLEFLNDFNGKKAHKFSEEFLTNTIVLLKSCLEDNNFNLYIQAIEVTSAFLYKALFTDVVQGSLPALIKPVVLRTTDTNTRLRKKSVELIYQAWSQQPPQVQIKSSGQQEQQPQNLVPQMIADVICDASLSERAIIGRLGLFVKRASMIDGVGEDELSKKAHQVILGRNYEQLVEFACQWCMHKNIKVRQNALKLIVEICRVNTIDPRGSPFKQRIINMILMLRPSLRDPLVSKINEVCSSTESGPYIDVNELELNLATKSSSKRAMSMDVHKSRAGKGNSLPEIAGGVRVRDGNSGDGILPSVGNAGISLSAAQPQLVLPHSENMSDEQKSKAANMIELFGQEIVQCFFSQTWSNRSSAIEKIEEQLHNIDPNRRDAMSAEINRKNLPIDQSFKIFLEFIDEGSKDPVLKNFISIVDLLKKSLPTFFRYIQPQTVKKELMPVVASLIKKTTDLKVKVREISIDLCLYLSHQSPIGPECMVNQVLTELEMILTEQSSSAATSSNVAANMGNSHMISSCFKLLNQFQQQSKILDKTLKTFLGQQIIFTRFVSLINGALRHQNPQVRKEGELLFKLLYLEFGEKLDSLLVNQKQQVVTKLIMEAKQEAGLGSAQQEVNLQRAQSHIRSEIFNSSTLNQVLKGQEEHLQNLRLPNVKKRLTAVTELRKAVQKELVGVQGNPSAARLLFEPLSMLIRQLLSDEEPDIYMETLNILRAVVGALVPHMSTLDVHLMLGSFIGVIVSNTVSGNIRTQMASDKVIIFFAKHGNIGPFVVAKDILKNIEKVIKAVSTVTKREEQISVLHDKKATVLRFLSILQLLLQHFSIVLCYQPEFYEKCVEIVADTMVVLAQEDQSIKNLGIQLITNLQKIDAKLFDQAISKMDFSRKTPLRKALIELDNQSRAGKNVLTQDHHAFANQTSNQGPNEVPASPMGARDTRGSNMTLSSRTSLFSPGATLRGASPGGQNNLGMTSGDWSRASGEVGSTYTPQHYGAGTAAAMMSSTIRNPEGRAARRMISLENENPRGGQTGATPTQSGMLGPKQPSRYREEMLGSTPNSSAKKDLVLPEIIGSNSTITPLGSTTNTSHNMRFNPTGGFINSAAAVTTKMSLQSTGGAGFSSANNMAAPLLKAAHSTDSNTNNQLGATGGIRPPLYVPQKRDAARAGTGMLNGNGISGMSTQQLGQPVTLLNRTGPLPSSYQPPSDHQPSLPTGFKTEFNSNLYAGIGSSASTAASTSGNIGGMRSSSLQKKPTLAGSTLFKPQPPQAAATFETNVTRYKESTPKDQQF